jgi:RNA polymerase sigma factor (sigma-70 family)
MAVLRYLRHVTCTQEGGEQSDGQLLQQFVTQRNEGAFAVLLERHGPLVLAVCRQVLRERADAEDAFQATFLVLARRAGSIRNREALAAWLHRVALNISRTTKAATAQRRAHERQAVLMSQATPVDEVELRDWQPLLHEEVDRLPEKYRVPVIRCYFEGMSHEETARQLAWPVGTVKGRLARARDLLRSRLARRGLALTSAALALALAEGATAEVQPALLGSTLRAAASFAAGLGTSARAVSLAEGVLQAMTTRKPVLVAALFLAVALLGAGSGLFWHQFALGSHPSPETPKDASAGQVPSADAKEEIRSLQLPGAEVLADPLPPGALARMGTVRFRHGGPVSSLAYLVKGKFLASGGYVGTIWDGHGRVRLWETETGKEVRQFHLQGSAQVAASPDGKILAGASAGDGNVYLWDAATGREIRRLKGSRGFDGNFCSLAFSPNGKVLALGGHALHVWRVETGELVHFENDEDHPVLKLEFSGDGKILAMTRVDEDHLQLLEVNSWRKRAPFMSRRAIMAFALPDHKTLVAVERATAEENSRSLGLYDLATGQQLRKFEGHRGEVHGLVLSPDGETLATSSSDRTIRIWDVATGKERQTLPADRYALGALTFAPDRKTLAWANSAGQIRIWSLATGTAFPPATGHQGVVTSVALSANGNTLFSAGTDGTVRIWDAGTGKELGRLGGHDGPVAALALSPNGKRLASVSPADRTVRLSDLAGGKEIQRLPASVPYCEVAWLSDNTTLAVRRYDDQAVYFYGAAGNVIRKIEGTLPPNVMVIPDRHTEAAHSGGFLVVAPDGRTLATCSNFCHPSFQLWQIATGKKLHHPAVEALDQAAAMSAVFSPDSRTVFTATYRTIRVWEVATGKQLQQFVAHEERINRLALSPDGKTLALVGSEPTVRLWDVATAKERRRLEGHQGQVTSLAWSADGQTLASGSADGTALVWDLRK